MPFFILKKPAFITFNLEKYSENTSLISKHQILSNETVHNASLVKHRNGKWYIKYGNKLIEMKEVPCKEIAISELKEESGIVIEESKSKWFLQNPGNL